MTDLSTEHQDAHDDQVPPGAGADLALLDAIEPIALTGVTWPIGSRYGRDELYAEPAIQNQSPTESERPMLQMKEPTFVLDRDGNQVAAIVDIDSYHSLLETLEDLEDILAARQALAEDPHGLPFDEAMREVERMAAEEAGAAQ